MTSNGDGQWRQSSRQGPEWGLDDVSEDDVDDFGLPGADQNDSSMAKSGIGPSGMS